MSTTISSKCQVVSQKIASYFMGCKELWKGNDVSNQEGFPNYLIKLYCGIVQNIQVLWDNLNEAIENEDLTDEQIRHTQDVITNLEKELGGSNFIPSISSIDECSHNGLVETVDRKIRQYNSQTVDAKKDKSNKRKKSKENDEHVSKKLSNGSCFPDISGNTSSRKDSDELKVSNGYLSESDDSICSIIDETKQRNKLQANQTQLPSIRSSGSLVGSPNFVSPSSPEITTYETKISHGFNPPNMETLPSVDVRTANKDDMNGIDAQKARIASLSSASTSRLSSKWRTNVGYPYGSSFPQLPPISKKRRLTGTKQDSS